MRARKEETSSFVILFVTILAVAGALVDIGYGLPKTKNLSLSKSVFGIAVSVTGVFLAWLLLHVMYSLHYAKVYYGKTLGWRREWLQERAGIPGKQRFRGLLGIPLLLVHHRHVFPDLRRHRHVALYAAADTIPCDRLVPFCDGDSRIAARRIYRQYLNSPV